MTISKKIKPPALRVIKEGVEIVNPKKKKRRKRKSLARHSKEFFSLLTSKFSGVYFGRFFPFIPKMPFQIIGVGYKVHQQKTRFTSKKFKVYYINLLGLFEFSLRWFN
jgi:hypothetical protein